MRTNSWIPAVFNDIFNTDFMPKASATAPAINVKETDEAYIVEVAAPGLRKEDFFVNINDEGNLVVKMEQNEQDKQEAEKAHYLRREFSYTNYEQNYTLPDDVEKDKIAAKVEDGILTITMPKLAKQETATKAIEIL